MTMNPKKLAAGLSVAVAVAAMASCTIRFDFTECASQEDCAQLESPGVYYACESDQCVPDTSIECRSDDACDDGETCTDGKCEGGDNNGENNGDGDMGNNGVGDMGNNGTTDMAPADGDSDGVPDADDNCPATANADQADADSDGVGDACDNCPDDANGPQANADTDSHGDACDNCIDIANEDQADIDSDMIGDACDPDVRTPCTGPAQCTGATEQCISGFCTELTTAECPQVLGESDAASVFTMGVILPTSPPYQNIGPPLAKSVELAIDEMNRAGGLPGGRRVAAVLCDSKGNSTVAQTAARHLVDNVEVSAIIGPLFSTPFIDMVTNITRAAGVLTISPTATDPNITLLDDDDLAYRLLPSDKFQAKAIAERVRNLGGTSVITFFKDDGYGNGLFGALNSELATFLPNNSRTNISYADPATFNFDSAQIQMEFQSAIGQGLTARPNANVAIFIGTTEVVQLALGYAKTILANNGTPPRILFSHGAVPDMPSVAEDPQAGMVLDPLTSGVGPSIFNGEAFNQYNARFAAQFPGEVNLTISTLTYDAAATVYFAASSVPAGEEITGRKLADAIIPTMVDKDNGTPISAANSDFFAQGRSIIAGGGSIDYIGTSHEVDYDANGDILTDFLVFENLLNPQTMTWETAPQRLFPLSLNTWLQLCSEPYNRPCETDFTCSAQLPLPGVCLADCDPMTVGSCMSAPFVTCQDQGANGAVCTVPSP